MNWFSSQTNSPRDALQSRLMSLAAVFMFLFAVILSLSPAVRLHTWAVSYRWEHWAGVIVWLGGFGLLHRATLRLLPDRDPYLLPVAALLTGWGLLTVWRLDTILGLRQTIWLGLCLLGFWVGIKSNRVLPYLRRYKYLELTGGLLLTALTFIFGVYPAGEGPRLWLGCCGVYLQPSEPLKLLLLAYLAAYLADNLPVSFNLLSLLAPTLALTGAALVILVAQRDLGTASLFLFLYSVIIYLASGRRRILLVSGTAILLSGGLGYLLFDVIRIRVNAWVNPWADPSGRSYQIVQSLLAVASGGLLGTGPGVGSPGVVPVAHSDFIFAAIAEETGLMGTIALLALIGILAARGLRAALNAPNAYQRFLAAGLSTYLCAQGILIIAGNLRLLPLTGVTLPFVSYGGSSLVTSFASLLILLLVSSTGEREPAPLPNAQPYLLLSAGLAAGLVAIALVNGWWAIARASDLQTRADNPRRFINDRYVKRGALLDRDNQAISVTEGQPGSYERMLIYPPLSATIGYTHPLFGQAGLELTQDGYLRGIQGLPASMIWSSHILSSQPPPGLNVRLSLDLDLQRQADSLLGAHKGAVVLLNAASGEILAMASHPFVDPNQIEAGWNDWMADTNAPLLNRATQSQYSPGTAVAPFLAAEVARSTALPPLPGDLSVTVNGQRYTCVQPPPANPTWEWALGHGCPAALLALSQQVTPNQLLELYQQSGFYQAPALPLAVSSPPQARSFENPSLAALGEENLQVTPLQMALSAAALSQGGLRPHPRLVMAVDTPQQGWVILPAENAQPGLAVDGISAAARLLAVESQPYWRSLGSSLTRDSKVTWFLGGTLPGTAGTPLALAVALEEDNPALADQIGLELLSTAGR